MRYIKLILGIIIGLISIAVVVELIEFLLVKSQSEKSFEYLQSNQSEYFNIRNTYWILIFKLFYTAFGAALGGYITARISGSMRKHGISILIFIQVISVLWAGFISDLSSTGPTWMWIGLLIILPLGIWSGYNFHNKRYLKDLQ